LGNLGHGARFVLGDENQDHRDDEREQTEKFGSREADEQTALLAISGGWIAERALKERTKHISHTTCGNACANCGETGTDQLCCCCVHDKTPFQKSDIHLGWKKLSAN
jgi:hypothetical protein